MALITMTEAKDHLRVTHDEEDTDIQRKRDRAESLVLLYLEAEDNVSGSPPLWDDSNAPEDVRAAILVTLAELWRHRGDAEPAPRGPHGGMLSAQAEGYLRMRRSPALA